MNIIIRLKAQEIIQNKTSLDKLKYNKSYQKVERFIPFWRFSYWKYFLEAILGI